MPIQTTNAGRDRVELHNRLDVVVLSISDADGREAVTTMTPQQARAIAEHLGAAADAAERTPGS